MFLAEFSLHPSFSSHCYREIPPPSCCWKWWSDSLVGYHKMPLWCYIKNGEGCRAGKCHCSSCWRSGTSMGKQFLWWLVMWLSIQNSFMISQKFLRSVIILIFCIYDWSCVTFVLLCHCLYSAPSAFIEILRERMFKPALSTIISENAK